MLATDSERASVGFATDTPRLAAAAGLSIVAAQLIGTRHELAAWFALAELWRRPCQVVWS